MGIQNFFKVATVELKDDGLIEEFYDRIIANFDYGGELLYYPRSIVPMTFLQKPQMVLRCLMHLTMFMSLSSVLSAL